MKLLCLFIPLALFLAAVESTDELDDVSFDYEDSENLHLTNDEKREEDSLKIKYPQNEEEKRELIKKAMVAAFKKPGAYARLGQVLPIVRIMSPPQRLALASLVMAQVMAGPGEPLPPVSKTENITSQLMLPIAVDIATMFRGVGRENSEEGRSSYASSINDGDGGMEKKYK